MYNIIFVDLIVKGIFLKRNNLSRVLSGNQILCESRIPLEAKLFCSFALVLHDKLAPISRIYKTRLKAVNLDTQSCL